MSTPQQRQQWRELEQAATPGEWYAKWVPFKDTDAACIDNREQRIVTLYPPLENRHADAAFIAAARAAVPQLLADVDALTQEVSRLMEAGQDMQEQRDGWQQECEQARALARNEGAAHGDTIMHNIYLRDELAKVQRERDALAAELERVRAQANAEWQEEHAARLVLAEQLKAAEQRAEYLESVAEPEFARRDAEFALLDMLGDMN